LHRVLDVSFGDDQSGLPRPLVPKGADRLRRPPKPFAAHGAQDALTSGVRVFDSVKHTAWIAPEDPGQRANHPAVVAMAGAERLDIHVRSQPLNLGKNLPTPLA